MSASGIPVPPAEMPMSDQSLPFRTSDLRDRYPWMHLFRGAAMALDPRKILLGALGALAMTVGWWLIGSLFVVDEPTGAAEVSGQSMLARTQYMPWESAGGDELTALTGGDVDVFHSPVRKDGWSSTGWLPSAFWLVAEPVRQLTYPVQLMFQSHRAALAGAALALWTLFVWSWFGGAITRIAAVQFGGRGTPGIGDAFRFVSGRFLSYFAAPALPFVALLVLVLVCAIVVVPGWLPGLNLIVALLWPVVLLAGAAMAVVLLGWAVGWPLMFAAVSAEATESFEAISRSYSYVLQRGWRYFLYLLVSLVYGGLLAILLVVMTYWTMHLSHYAASWGLGAENTRIYYAYVPTAGGWRDDFGVTHAVARAEGAATDIAGGVDAAVARIASEPAADDAADADAAADDVPERSESGMGVFDHLTALVVGFWTHLVFMVMVGFAYSYFWSIATIIYFLLRQQVDETELDEVFYDESDEPGFLGDAPAGLGGTGAAAGTAAAGVGNAVFVPGPTRTAPASPDEPVVEPPQTVPLDEDDGPAPSAGRPSADRPDPYGDEPQSPDPMAGTIPPLATPPLDEPAGESDEDDQPFGGSAEQVPREASSDDAGDDETPADFGATDPLDEPSEPEDEDQSPPSRW